MKGLFKELQKNWISLNTHGLFFPYPLNLCHILSFRVVAYCYIIRGLVDV